jgi:hypothetical protein
MSAPPSDSPLPPDDDDLGDLDDLDKFDDAEPSGDAASDPETARREAEDALAEIEALADLDDTTEPESDPTAESRSDSSESDDRSAPEGQCENCGALLDGPFCSQCGQRARDRIVPIWHMANEALESLFQLDLRVFRTLPTFLFFPGRLTKEYLNGRRQRYIRPFRLYLFSTFLLFAVIALTTTGNFGFTLDPQGMARLNPPNTGITASRSPDTTAAATESGSIFGDPERREQIANEIESDSGAVNVSFYADPDANAHLERILRTKIAQAVRNPWDFVNRTTDRGPYLMFLMLPIFALLLKILYIRHGRLYVEHLIFSLHVHALAFFAFTVGLLLDQSNVGWLDTAATWIEVSPLLYLILAMRHVYEQGVFKSTLKALFLLLTYSVLLSIGFFALLVVVVLLM